jgi:predicted phage tail protein
MKVINLHGKIAERFGARWELEVESVIEALRAIEANTGCFFRYLSENKEENKTFSFILDDCPQKIEKEEELLTSLPSKCKEFHIIPNAEGAGPLAPFLVPLMISLATGFIMRALFRPPKPEEEKRTKSFLFSNAENVTSQGVPVPIAYGRLLVGSVVVSATMRHVDRGSVDSTSRSSNVANVEVHIPFVDSVHNLSQFIRETDEYSPVFEGSDPKGSFSLGNPGE